MCFIVGFSSCRRGDSVQHTLQSNGLQPAATAAISPVGFLIAVQTTQCVLDPVSTFVDQINCTRQGFAPCIMHQSKCISPYSSCTLPRKLLLYYASTYSATDTNNPIKLISLNRQVIITDRQASLYMRFQIRNDTPLKSLQLPFLLLSCLGYYPAQWKIVAESMASKRFSDTKYKP